MSVDAFRKFIAKYGAYIFGLMFVAFAISFISYGGRCNATQAPGPEVNEGPPFATIGNFNATSFEVDQLVNGASRDPNSGPMTPETIAKEYAVQTSSVVDHLYGIALAAEKGIVLDDKAVQEAIPSLWSQQLDTFRSILTSNKQLAPTASDADFAKVFQQTYGMTLDQKKQEFTDNFNAAYAEPGRKELIKSEIATQQLEQKYSALNSPTDDELKNYFGTYKIQQLKVLAKPGVDAKAIADKALADIKGGMKFEDAIKKYSNDKPVPGKSLTDPQDFQSFMFEFNPSFRPILDLKEGEVSGVIDSGMTPGTEYTIYKVFKFTPNVPKDFETQKIQVRKTMEQMGASTQLKHDMDDLKKSGKLQWKSAAFHALYDFATAGADDPTKKDAQLKAAQAEAKDALKSDTDNSRPAAYAYFITTKTMYDAAKPAQQKDLTADRIASLQAILQNTEDADTRMTLVDLYIQSDKPSDAVDQLVSSAKALSGTDEYALDTYEKVLSREDKLSAENKMPADKKTIIDKAIDDWRKTMQDEQQIRVQSLKEQEKLEKENAAAMAKAKAEEEAKKKADAAKAKTAPAPAAGKPTATTAAPTPGTSPTSTAPTFIPPHTTGK